MGVWAHSRRWRPAYSRRLACSPAAAAKGREAGASGSARLATGTRPRTSAPRASRLPSPPPPAAVPRPKEAHGTAVAGPPPPVRGEVAAGRPRLRSHAAVPPGPACAATAPAVRLRGTARHCMHAGATPAQKVREVARFASSFPAHLLRVRRGSGAPWQKGRGQRVPRPLSGAGMGAAGSAQRRENIAARTLPSQVVLSQGKKGGEHRPIPQFTPFVTGENTSLKFHSVCAWG